MNKAPKCRRDREKNRQRSRLCHFMMPVSHYFGGFIYHRFSWQRIRPKGKSVAVRIHGVRPGSGPGSAPQLPGQAVTELLELSQLPIIQIQLAAQIVDQATVPDPLLQLAARLGQADTLLALVFA